MPLSRDEIFAKAKKAHAEEKAKQAERRNNTYYDYEDTIFTALGVNQDKAIRLVGNPMEARMEVSDPKRIFFSMIVGDDGKKFRCIWPSKDEDPNWIMWKVMNLVLGYKWNNNKGEKGGRDYFYEESHPEIFKRVSKNNNVENNYEGGWYPGQAIIFNVLDRHDMEWHRENKHTKLLSKRANEYEGGIFFDLGIPYACYSTIWDDVVEYEGDWQNYDIVIRKQRTSPFYRAFAGSELKKISEEVHPLIVDGPMTAEEKAWERYDLDSLYRITKYTKIKKHLDVFFQQVDVAFGKKFHQELLDLVEKEKKEFEATKKDEGSKKVFKAADVEKSESKKEEPKADMSDPVAAGAHINGEEAPKQRRRAANVNTGVSSEIWEKLADGSHNGTKYIGVPEMTDEEKSMVLSVNEDGSFEYVKEFNGKKVQLYAGEVSNFMAPEQFHVDPLNGDRYDV